MDSQTTCGQYVAAISGKPSMFRRRSYVCSLALVVCLAASCSTQTTSDSADSALEATTTTTEEETTTTTEEDLREVVIKSFQKKLNRYMDKSRINLQELSDILRRNEVFGELFEQQELLLISWVETKICEDFAIADFFANTTVGGQRKDEVIQDLLEIDTAKWPDVVYTFTLTSFTDIDTRSVKKNAARLTDIFSLSPDKRCTGTLKTGPELERSQSFTTGNFPGAPANGFDTYNYVQFGNGPERFARSVSLIILEPANSAVSIVVTAFNLRTQTGSKVTSDDMLDEIGRIARDLKTLWENKIQTDLDWLALNY